jgi:hypothetical protein
MNACDRTIKTVGFEWSNGDFSTRLHVEMSQRLVVKWQDKLLYRGLSRLRSDPVNIRGDKWSNVSSNLCLAGSAIPERVPPLPERLAGTSDRLNSELLKFGWPFKSSKGEGRANEKIGSGRSIGAFLVQSRQDWMLAQVIQSIEIDLRGPG